MQIEVKHRPAFSLAVATLDPGEQIRVEPGAMVSHSDGVTSEARAEGGFFGGLKRMMGGESFFQSTFRAPGDASAEITLAPSLPGDMLPLTLGAGALMLRSGAFVAGETSVQLDTTWGGARGFFGGSLLLLKVTGSGTVLASAYGAIEQRELQPGEGYVVDTGHVVGFDDSVQFEIHKSGSFRTAVLGGEGLVCRLTGPGRVWIQSRSEEAFLGWLLPKLPSPSR